MTTVMPSLCLSCIRRHPDTSPTGSTVAVTCDAFPDGIPNDILRGADHRQPRDGDHGLQHRQAEGENAAVLFQAWQRFANA